VNPVFFVTLLAIPVTAATLLRSTRITPFALTAKNSQKQKKEKKLKKLPDRNLFGQ
tara:strand:+ start:594 stop:761 length:168 start_codon:yes stop_codon:yes gene_type:complete